MSTAEQRLRMAASIVGFEARRDAQGRLAIYRLPPDDGGGTFEVAGINDRYHPVEAQQLADLINAGRFQEAEEQANAFIATYTDVVVAWSSSAAIECYLRDCAFNRGPRGAARILQRAVGVRDDGVVGAHTNAAVATAEQDAGALLRGVRDAREQYERQVVGRDETSRFWKGLVNRWNKAATFAQTFLPTVAVADMDAKSSVGGSGLMAEDEPFSASAAAIGNALTRSEVATASAPSMQASAPPILSAGPVLSAAPQPVTMPAMRLGVRGDLVRAWQSFLLGQGFDPGGLDGSFGDKTEAATEAFQSREGLASDGVAGRVTILRAMQLGFELIDEPAADSSGSNFPPRPDFPPLVSTAARQSLFGRFDFVADPQPGNREHIRILGSWQQDNIIEVPLPQLRAVLGPATQAVMRFHRLAADQLKGLWSDWEQAGLLGRILSFDGSFVPRFIRGSASELSNHAFGSAFDINAAANPLGVRPKLVGQPGSVRELVPLANRRGFYWGGHFGSRPDGMHFEIAILQ